MREFIYYSKNAVTAGNFIKDDLMRAGRMDIVCQIVIMAFFVSHHTREDVKLHLVFDGPPNAPMHLELFPGENFSIESENKIDISKKDIAGLIKKMLYKYKAGKKVEVAPGYFIEKKGLNDLVEDLIGKGKKVYLLEKRGEDIREIKDLDKGVFVIGDQDGIPKQELRKLKNLGIEKISVGNQMYFASQTLTILQAELDRRNL